MNRFVKIIIVVIAMLHISWAGITILSLPMMANRSTTEGRIASEEIERLLVKSPEATSFEVNRDNLEKLIRYAEFESDSSSRYWGTTFNESIGIIFISFICLIISLRAKKKTANQRVDPTREGAQSVVSDV